MKGHLMSGYLAASPETSRMSMPGSLSRTNSARTGSRASGLISGSEPSPSCRHISDTHDPCSTEGWMCVLLCGIVVPTDSYWQLDLLYLKHLIWRCCFLFFVKDFNIIPDLPALCSFSPNFFAAVIYCTIPHFGINKVLALLFQMMSRLHIFVRATTWWRLSELMRQLQSVLVGLHQLRGFFLHFPAHLIDSWRRLLLTRPWKSSRNCWSSWTIWWASCLRSSPLRHTSLFCIRARTYSTTISHWASSCRRCGHHAQRQDGRRTSEFSSWVASFVVYVD